MKYPFDDEPPAALVKRAEREKNEDPGRKVRPFVRELADRGGITPAEWAVRMNSYERRLLEPLLQTELLAGHMEYCAANSGPALRNCADPVTYDESLAMVLVPAAARRLRLYDAECGRLRLELERRGEVTFGVEVCDDHDGGSVWLIEDEWFEMREEADELAAKYSRVRDNEAARVVQVTRRVVADYRGGEQTELREGQSRHVEFSLLELTEHQELPRPSTADLERWRRLAEERERPPPRVLAMLVKEVERLRTLYERPFDWKGLERRGPSEKELELTGPDLEKVEPES